MLGSAKQCDTHKTRTGHTWLHTHLERPGVEPGQCPSRVVSATPSAGGSAQPAWSSLLSSPSLVTARGKEVTFQLLWMKTRDSPGASTSAVSTASGAGRDRVATLGEAQTVGSGVSSGLPVQRQGPVQHCLVTQLTCCFTHITRGTG